MPVAQVQSAEKYSRFAPVSADDPTRMKNPQTGEILPWWTPASLEWLLDYEADGRLAKARVLEWGCGDSSLWFAKRCAIYRGVEHDRAVCESFAKGCEAVAYAEASISIFTAPITEIARHIGPTAHHRVHHVPVPDLEHGVDRAHEVSVDIVNPYVLWPVNRGLFDLVVIDGLYRRACARIALRVLAPGGTLVFENADWPEFGHETGTGWSNPGFLEPGFASHTRFCRGEHRTDVFEGFKGSI